MLAVIKNPRIPHKEILLLLLLLSLLCPATSIAPQSPNYSLVQPRSRSNPIFNRVSNPMWAQSNPNPFQLQPIHSNPMQPNPVHPMQSPIESPVQCGPTPFQTHSNPVQSNPIQTEPIQQSPVKSILLQSPIQSGSGHINPVQYHPLHPNPQTTLWPSPGPKPIHLGKRIGSTKRAPQ